MASTTSTILIISLTLIINTVLSSFECSNRRCCSYKPSTIPSSTNIDCNTLSLEECLETYGYICQWDCSPSNTNSIDSSLKNAGFTSKTYIRISSGNGEYSEPKLKGNNFPESTNTQPKTINEVIKQTSITSVDDCGVVYQYDLDEESAAQVLTRLSDDDIDEQQPSDTNANRRLTDKLIRRLTVFNNDGRTEVTSSGSYDFNGYLQFSTGNGDEKRCSASLVADDVVITAAHCIHSGIGPWTPEYYSNWRFYPGTNGDIYDMSSRQFTAIAIWTLSEWLHGLRASSGEWGPNWDFDIGWIQLATPATGYPTINFHYNDNLSHGQVFKTVGYPGDKSWLTQWFQQCDWGYVGTDFMATDSCDIYAGSSGSPVYRDVYRYSYSSQKRIYQNEINCIVSWENDYVNGCARITQSKHYALCSSITSGKLPAGTCV